MTFIPRRFLRVIICTSLCIHPIGHLLAKTPAENPKKKAVAKQSEEAKVPPKVASPVVSSTSSSVKETESSRKAAAAPNATIPPEEIIEFSGETPRVKALIESALELTTQGLTYTAASDDPAKGGMDCSGFIAHVLRKHGFADVPRDSSRQYVWLRRAGTFRAVLSEKADTFELDDLRPGDLLFWVGTYATPNDPPVSHVMIYLGREKGTKNRVMVGSSNGRTYQGKSRWGVSVFDFRLSSSKRTTEGGKSSTFVGYARLPGLRD